MKKKKVVLIIGIIIIVVILLTIVLHLHSVEVFSEKEKPDAVEISTDEKEEQNITENFMDEEENSGIDKTTVQDQNKNMNISEDERTPSYQERTTLQSGLTLEESSKNDTGSDYQDMTGEDLKKSEREQESERTEEGNSANSPSVDQNKEPESTLTPVEQPEEDDSQWGPMS